MLAEILTIGDELCRGEIIDTNAAWLAGELWLREVEVAWKTTCRDQEADIRQAVKTAASRADLVLTSGGLGPTEDDLTVDALAGLGGVAPEIHEPSRSRMVARYGQIGMKVVDNAWRQVRIPIGAVAYDNPVGQAPGFELPIDGVPIIALPGVPRELEAIFTTHVVGRIDELLAARGTRSRIARRVWRTFGKGESHIAAALDGLLADAPGATLHYNVSFPETLVKLVVRASDLASAKARLDQLGAEVARRLAGVIYGEGDDTLAGVLGSELARRDLTIATAESCTGGLVGGLLTSAPGASRYYVGGAICYANHEKVRALGVDPATLAAHGAVSEACVREMATGARHRLGADMAVAVSGLAGPDGGTAGRAVGDVWLAVAGPGERMTTKQLRWPGTRDQIRTLAAHWALALCRRALGPVEAA